jgi:MoxR-like ATPase
MKIRKQKLVENKLDTVVEDIDTTEIEAKEEIPAIDDISSADIDEIATAVQAAAEEASDGEETFSDEKAKTIAKELKTYAQGFDAAAWAPLDVPSELTDKLDDCLANAMAAQAAGTRDGVDLLITGLPGSGKTGITKQWAEDRGVKLFYLNAKNDDLGAILNGFPVDSAETDADGNTTHKVVRSYSTALDPLKRPRSVLFLDEFNRAAPKLRASLLTLINEHEVEGPGEKGTYRFDNLLFTVACINPSVPTDPGAMDLNDAEMSRFVDSIDWDSKADDAIRYIVFHINKLLKALDPADENYAFFYKRYHKILNLANALIGDYRFEFDSRDDLLDLFNDKAKMLNQRAITDALMAHGYNKEKFLNWVDKYSKFLEKDKVMIHDILDSYVEQDVTVPGENGASTSSAAPSATTTNTKTNTSSDSGDFDDVFGTEGDEADADLFGNTASAAGAAAKVSAADALNRIKAFDFSL